jgi:hypothetical protein
VVAGEDDSARVTVEVWMPKQEVSKDWLSDRPIQITSKNSKGQEFRGLLMPLT